jgi:hypothetical protein
MAARINETTVTRSVENVVISLKENFAASAKSKLLRWCREGAEVVKIFVAPQGVTTNDRKRKRGKSRNTIAVLRA